MGIQTAVKDGVFGYGESEMLANIDLQYNLCRQNIKYDTGQFKSRRNELKPWMPRPNILHIHTIGCLIYENGVLTETKSGKSTEIDRYGMAMFSYLMELFGSGLSFTDITIVLQTELDKLFQGISKQFVLIRDLPSIILQGANTGFAPTVIYKLECGLYVGKLGTLLGVRPSEDEYFRIVDSDTVGVSLPALAYICSRLGYVVQKEGIYNVKEA